jgi:hypothetical protein
VSQEFASTSRLCLDNGRELELSREEARHLYEELWRAAGARGALAAAAKLVEAQRAHRVSRPYLSRDESKLVCRLLTEFRSQLIREWRD